MAMEIFIEAVFDVVHRAVHLLLSPSEALGTLSRLFSSHDDVAEDASTSSATLGDNEPTPTDRNTSSRSSLNTDARTCQDVITELG